MAHFGTNRWVHGITKVTQVCMDFGEDLRKRKTQVMQILRSFLSHEPEKMENTDPAPQHFRSGSCTNGTGGILLVR